MYNMYVLRTAVWTPITPVFYLSIYGKLAGRTLVAGLAAGFLPVGL